MKLAEFIDKAGNVILDCGDFRYYGNESIKPFDMTTVDRKKLLGINLSDIEFNNRMNLTNPLNIKPFFFSELKVKTNEIFNSPKTKLSRLLSFNERIPFFDYMDFLNRKCFKYEERYVGMQPITRLGLRNLFGSWKIEPIERLVLPTLANYWSIKDQEGRYIKYPIEIRAYRIIQSVFDKKHIILLIKPKFLGIERYFPIMVDNIKNVWKFYYQPLIVCKVKSKDKSFKKIFDKSAYAVIYYNFLFNSYMLRVMKTRKSGELLKDCYFALDYIENIAERSILTPKLKKVVYKNLGNLIFSDFQAINGSDLVDRYYPTQHSYTPRSIPDLNLTKLSIISDELLPKNIKEIEEYSKPLVEKQLEAFPEQVRNGKALRFEHLEKSEGHVGIYLLFGKDKTDDKWIIKVGRTKDFKQRAILYNHLLKTKNDHFKNNSNVVLVDFLKLDDIGDLPKQVDSRTYEGAEALFRNFLLYLQPPKYPNEWFDGNDKDKQRLLIDGFNSLKRFIIKRPKLFYDFLHDNPKQKPAAYVRQKLANQTAQEAMLKFQQKKGQL